MRKLLIALEYFGVDLVLTQMSRQGDQALQEWLFGFKCLHLHERTELYLNELLNFFLSKKVFLNE